MTLTQLSAHMQNDQLNETISLNAYCSGELFTALPCTFKSGLVWAINYMVTILHYPSQCKVPVVNARLLLAHCAVQNHTVRKKKKWHFFRPSLPSATMLFLVLCETLKHRPLASHLLLICYLLPYNFPNFILTAC